MQIIVSAVKFDEKWPILVSLSLSSYEKSQEKQVSGGGGGGIRVGFVAVMGDGSMIARIQWVISHNPVRLSEV